jgi:hypothetical protein
MEITTEHIKPLIFLGYDDLLIPLSSPIIIYYLIGFFVCVWISGFAGLELSRNQWDRTAGNTLIMFGGILSSILVVLIINLFIELNQETRTAFLLSYLFVCCAVVFIFLVYAAANEKIKKIITRMMYRDNLLGKNGSV